MPDEYRADDGGAPPPVALPPRFRFEEVLGEGGLGTVVRAYDTQLRVPVAIKTIRHDLATQDQQHYTLLRERFRREAIAGARVRDSAHVVTVYDQIADSGGDAFLVLQFMPGGTLRDRIRGGPLPIPAALRLVADAARGLQDLHDADLVHRDIKPENIFLAADGRALVGDLGIVQMSTTTFRTRLEYGSDHGHPGTPMYMSPEQEFSTGMLTPEADQYSLGCVLFELVTGKRYKQLYDDERAALLDGLPRPVADCIRRMTAEKPAERYRGVGAVLTAIGDIERNQSVAAPVPPRMPPPSRPPDRTASEPTVPAVVLPSVRTPEPRPAARSLPVHAQPVPAAAQRPVSRRTVLGGIGGVAAVGGAAAIWGVSQRGASPPPTPTAAPTRAPAIAPTTATAAPPTATPIPAPSATPTPAPTATAQPTATPVPRPAIVLSPAGTPVIAYQGPSEAGQVGLFGDGASVIVIGPAEAGPRGGRWYPIGLASGNTGYIPEANIRFQ